MPREMSGDPAITPKSERILFQMEFSSVALKHNLYKKYDLYHELYGRGVPSEVRPNVPDSVWNSILVYPFHTLSTNRILNTVISRKTKQRNLFADFRDMWQIGGSRVLMAGVLPATFFSLLAVASADVIWAKKNQERSSYFFKFHYGFSLLFFPMSTILIVRAQCIDYPFRSRLWQSFKDMIRHDRLWCMLRGAIPILAGQAIGICGLRIADFMQIREKFRRKLVEDELKLEPKLDGVERFKRHLSLVGKVIPPITMGILLMHPLQVIGMQVIYSRFNASSEERQMYRNTLTAYKAIKKTQGIRGFYRGFVPAMVTYMVAY